MVDTDQNWFGLGVLVGFIIATTIIFGAFKLSGAFTIDARSDWLRCMKDGGKYEHCTNVYFLGIGQ